MDTVGSLIDKLCTVDLKMWNAQEGLYRIRHMSLEEFKVYCENNIDEVFSFFKRSMDLNYQRNCLIDEIDERLIEMVRMAQRGLDLEKYCQRKHKTY